MVLNELGNGSFGHMAIIKAAKVNFYTDSLFPNIQISCKLMVYESPNRLILPPQSIKTKLDNHVKLE